LITTLTEGGIAASQIGVICLYRAQAALVTSLLAPPAAVVTVPNTSSASTAERDVLADAVVADATPAGTDDVVREVGDYVVNVATVDAFQVWRRCMHAYVCELTNVRATGSRTRCYHHLNCENRTSWISRLARWVVYRTLTVFNHHIA
jgi:hypothetical protein